MTPSPPTDQPPAFPWAPAPQPRREVTSRTWVKVLVGWAVVLLAAGAWALTHPRPTERDQTTVAQARPVVDEAIARVARAASADGVVAVTGFDRVDECDISVVRSGVRYRRSLSVLVPPDTEAAELDRVAAALPAGYAPVVRHGDSPRLTADVGLYVLLSGSVVGPGELRFQADTGDCRPAGDLTATDPPSTVPADLVPGVLAGLGLTSTGTTSAAVPCPEGGVVSTVQAQAGAFTGDLSLLLGGSGAGVVAQPRLVAYRTDSAQVAVWAHDDATIVTATTVCGE